MALSSWVRKAELPGRILKSYKDSAFVFPVGWVVSCCFFAPRSRCFLPYSTAVDSNFIWALICGNLQGSAAIFLTFGFLPTSLVHLLEAILQLWIMVLWWVSVTSQTRRQLDWTAVLLRLHCILAVSYVSLKRHIMPAWGDNHQTISQFDTLASSQAPERRPRQGIRWKKCVTE